MEFGAARTDAVAELSRRVIRDVGLQPVPVALVVADAFAPRADGQQSLQGLDIVQGVLGVVNGLLEPPLYSRRSTA